jgi:hypothetical protein
MKTAVLRLGAEEKQRPVPQTAGSSPADLQETLSQDLCRL